MKLNLLRAFLITAVFFISVNGANADQSWGANDQDYLAFAEEMPAVVGGMSSIIKKIKYPDIAIQTKVQGRVYILAYVDEDGSCSEAKVIKGIGAGCDEAAVEAVKSVKFMPGKNKGLPVKVKLSLPITFAL